jgi:dihydroxy-acid dehydratase
MGKITKDKNFSNMSIRERQRMGMKAAGFSDVDLDRPLIGIVNTYNETLAGHVVFKQLVDYVRRGIYRAGGSTSEFGTIACCDAMGASHIGNYYLLPSREVIADSVEVMAMAHQLDGLVMMASCDKIVPGVLIAAARLDIPCIVLTGGPMISSIEVMGAKAHLGFYPSVVGMMNQGSLSPEQVDDFSDLFCPSCGSCQFFGTANSMGTMAEALGMSLPGSAMIPAPYTERQRNAFATGEAIVELVKKKITACQIMTKKAMENAFRVAMATGASTNAIIHLTAISYTLGFDTDEINKTFNDLSSKTPVILNVCPAAPEDCEDFYKAGGVPRVLKHLKPLLNTDVLTVTGKTLEENINNYHFNRPENKKMITTLESPFASGDSLVMVRGNLCPDGGLAKPVAMNPKMRQFTGKAVVFNSEEECAKGLAEGKVKDGHVVVVRYEGPKGGPGMREMAVPLKTIQGLGLENTVAIITDGRFAGMNNGCFVGHMTPEAAEGGPIAIVEDGDEITIDLVDKKVININLKKEEIDARFAKWKYKPKTLKGFMAKYVKLVQPASKGAVLI